MYFPVYRKVVEAFKQNICGFDLLRTDRVSYVVDVNGFSFVKNSSKYYDDCAHILARSDRNGEENLQTGTFLKMRRDKSLATSLQPTLVRQNGHMRYHSVP